MVDMIDESMSDTGMSAAYPRFEDAPWKGLRLTQQAGSGDANLASGGRPELRFELSADEYGWPVLAGSCPAKKRKRPIVYEKPFRLHGGYLHDLAKLHPEALPDLPATAAAAPGGAPHGRRRLVVTTNDGSTHEKDAPDDVFERIAERLTTAMQARFRSDTKLHREMQREGYRIFAAIREDDFGSVKALVAQDPTLVNAVAPEKPADTKWMSPLEVALSAGSLRDPSWSEEVNWKRGIAWYLLERGADVNYQAPRTYLSFDAPVLFAATVNAVRNVRQHRRVSDGTHSLVIVRTKEESDDAFRFLVAMVNRDAKVDMLDHDGRNVLREALWEAGKIAGDGSSEETEKDLLRIFRLLVEAGADRENVVPRTGQSIRESFADDPIWPLCATLF